VIYHIVYIPVIYRLNMDEQKTTTKTIEEWQKERADYERAERRAIERAVWLQAQRDYERAERRAIERAGLNKKVA
jgi:hypothetical protein